ncbi:MAG: type II CAAX endopeptidase family protein [Novosphingobium sp.]
MNARDIGRGIMAFPLTRMVLSIGVVLLAMLVGAQGLARMNLPDHPAFEVLGALLTATLVVLAYKAIKRWIERAPDRELALTGAGRELGAGLLLGAGLFTVTAGAVILLGGMEVLGVRGMAGLWPVLAMSIVSAMVEEVLFRGVIQRQLEAMIGSWAALALTSALFGLSHLGNPEATAVSAAAIAVEAGVLLGAAFLLTRRLWLAIGIHAAWNFTQGWVFSAPVSGSPAPMGLLVTRRIGPEWLTGGSFGLEASVVAVVVASGAGLALLALAARRGNLMAPMWRRDARVQTKL